MANIDKNIVITPNVGQTAQPNIVFTGFNASPITLRVTDDGSLSWEGSAGQLFSISNSLTGTLFSINDISGLPILEITDTPNIITYAPITGAAGATIMASVCGLCDGARSVFDIKLDQTLVSSTYIVDSKDLEVVVSGQQMIPYVTPAPGAWIPAFDAGSSRTFRVRENRLIIYNAPEIGSQVQITVKKTSATRQRRRYPFSPTTIALGD
jgi:hypothetical protein